MTSSPLAETLAGPPPTQTGVKVRVRGAQLVSFPDCEGYEIERRVGSGGMGDVFQGRDRASGQEVAIKVLRPMLANDAESLERFRREAKHASCLKGPHSVRVLEWGETVEGLPFIVMELLRGIDLDALLSDGALPMREAVKWTLQASDAIREAHLRGVIHRDLKPANMFIADTEYGPILKVLDYGISRAVEHAPKLTHTRATLGTPLYMSPEQAQASKTIDHRTDVWSLGIILYELLTANTPFTGHSPTAIAVQICTQAPVPPTQFRPNIPAELERVILWALEKDPAMRPASVTEFAQALRAIELPSESSEADWKRPQRALELATTTPSNLPEPRDSQPRDSQPRDSQPRDSRVREFQAWDSEPRDSQPRDSRLRDTQTRTLPKPILVGLALGCAAAVGLMAFLGGAFLGSASAPQPAQAQPQALGAVDQQPAALTSPDVRVAPISRPEASAPVVAPSSAPTTEPRPTVPSAKPSQSDAPTASGPAAKKAPPPASTVRVRPRFDERRP